MAITSANQLELLQTAEAVAREKMIEREEVKRGDVDRSAYDSDRLNGRFQELERDLNEFTARSAETRTKVDQLAEADLQASRADVMRQLIAVLTDLSDELFELSLIQARIRLDSTNLVRIELDSGEAFKIARVNRLDLMNARKARWYLDREIAKREAAR